jgi:hypothetical protein
LAMADGRARADRSCAESLIDGNILTSKMVDNGVARPVKEKTMLS